ncbi:MAG: OmpA family protein [Verrucomicrobiaceae bacterium]|nr:OmpA family protein [Verrucomicrobiaceae bacterium]
MKPNLIVLASLFLSFPHLLSAQNAADLPGSKDPAGLKRYEGTRTTFFEEKAFGSYTLPLGKLTKKSNVNIFANSLALEGKVTKVTYISNDPNRTALEVFRNYQSELAAGGWETLWTGTGEELSAGKGILFRSLFADRPGGTFALSHPGAQYLAAKKGSAHLALFVANFKAGTVNPKSLQPKAGVPVIAIDLIESKDMEEKMVLVKAEEMASGIIQQGVVNLYGFHFDTASATLKPESDATLDEVAKLLKSDPALRLLVVGHTDIVGKFEGNIELSKNRAAAVVSALTQRLPAAATRLTPCGVGYQCPIASNGSEEGRAKNRRVALVKVEN